MRVMSNVFFQPWRGPRYGRGSDFGRSVLVLGESHYDEGFGPGGEYTNIVVRQHIDRGMHSKFFGGVGQTLAGPSYGGSPSRRRAVWDQVAFYNYVQGFAG